MVECPNCKRRTISRWQPRATCPICSARIRPRILPRILIFLVPWMCVARYQGRIVERLTFWQVELSFLSVLAFAVIFFFFFPMLKMVGKDKNVTPSEKLNK